MNPKHFSSPTLNFPFTLETFNPRSTNFSINVSLRVKTKTIFFLHSWVFPRLTSSPSIESSLVNRKDIKASSSTISKKTFENFLIAIINRQLQLLTYSKTYEIFINEFSFKEIEFSCKLTK